MVNNKYDAVVVGTGFSGSVIARTLADRLGYRVLIVDKRDHIGGNMYDYNEGEILVHKYGPHIFHTNSQKVYDFICRFTTPKSFKLRWGAVINGLCSPSPFNFKTIDMFYPKNEADYFKSMLRTEFGDGEVIILDLLRSKNVVIREFASFLLDNDFKPYAAKQWGRNLEEIDNSILKRVPFNLSYFDYYFKDKFQFLPDKGYSKMFLNILNHKNIEVRLETDVLNHLTFDNDMVLYDKDIVDVFYTGAIDSLFNHKFGQLPYRSLHFACESISAENCQEFVVVALPQDPKIVRITDYGKLSEINNYNKTIIAKEYSYEYDHKIDNSEPFYPIVNEKSLEALAKYKDEVSKYKNLFICGRLAEFKYYNMDQVISSALEKAE